MKMANEGGFSRRSVLRVGASAAGLLALGRVPGLAGVVPSKSDSPFKLGIQSYSLRHFATEKALELSRTLGLKYWESFSRHIPTNADTAPKAKLEAANQGVDVVGYGVLHFGKDHDANRRIFDFGKALGVAYISADPDPDAFDSLDKLVEEYGISIGIHNHGPGHRWDTIAKIRDAIKDHHKRVGCCIDTGHFLRSKQDPVEAAEAFEGRVYGVHLKDVKGATRFTILGEGDLRTADLLKVLAAQNYDYCLAIEYEENEQNPVDDIKKCIDATLAAMPR